MSDDEPPGARGPWVVDRRAGAWRRGRWPITRFNGSACARRSVYAFGTTTADLGPYEIRADSPSLLWRLDGATLAVLAERPFIGFSGRAVGAVGVGLSGRGGTVLHDGDLFIGQAVELVDDLVDGDEPIQDKYSVWRETNLPKRMTHQADGRATIQRRVLVNSAQSAKPAHRSAGF